MESFSNPIFQGIDSPAMSPLKMGGEEKQRGSVQEQKAMESLLAKQLQQELLKFQGLEAGLESHSYEDLKIEVLQLKNNLLTFQSKFERQKSTNNQNFSTIELLKQELAQKSKEIQRLSEENSKAKVQHSELLKLSESVIKSSAEHSRSDFRYSSTLLEASKATSNSEAELMKKLKMLETREKTLGSELLKGYDEKRHLEEKIKGLQKEIDSLKKEHQHKAEISAISGDRSRLWDVEKRSLLKEIGEAKNGLVKSEENLAAERENSKKKEAIIERLSAEKAKLLKDMNKTYEENSNFIAQIEQENQNHLMILQSFQTKIGGYESRIAELEKVKNSQAIEIAALSKRLEGQGEDQGKIKALETEISLLKESNKKTESALRESEQKLAKSTEDICLKENSFEAQKLTLCKEKSALELSLQALESKFKEQCEHSSVISKNVDLIMDELRTVKKANLELLSQIKAAEALQSGLENTLKSSDKEKESLQKALLEKNSEIEKLSKDLEASRSVKIEVEKKFEKQEYIQETKDLEENLRLNSQIREKSKLNEILEKRVEALGSFNRELSQKIEGLENENLRIRSEKANSEAFLQEHQRKTLQVERTLAETIENLKAIQIEKRELAAEKEGLEKQLNAKNQLINSYQKYQEEAQMEKAKKEGWESRRTEESLKEKTAEVESKDEEIESLKDQISAQSFSLKTMNQTLSNYREALTSTETQLRSLESEKTSLESMIRVLRQEIDGFDAEKAKFRDILSLSNQGKDRLIMELEMKDRLIAELQKSGISSNISPEENSEKIDERPKISKKPQKTPQIETQKPQISPSSQAQTLETPSKSSNRRKQQGKKGSKIKVIHLLKKDLKEESLYNEVLELSQEAIDLLKKYELLVNSVQKAKKTLKGNLKDYVRAEIQGFYRDFEGILRKYTEKEIGMKEWIGYDAYLKSGGPQEIEINETISNCRAFLLDFMTKEDLDRCVKPQKTRISTQNPKKHFDIEPFEPVSLALEPSESTDESLQSSFIERIRMVWAELLKKKNENADFIPKAGEESEKIIGVLEEVGKEIEGEFDFEKVEGKLGELLEASEKQGGLMLWLYVKRIQILGRGRIDKGGQNDVFIENIDSENEEDE